MVYPSILKRYLSTLIDSIFILSVLVIAGYIFRQNQGIVNQVRVGIILFVFFIYEPFCTSLFCTLGQKITGIRVRVYSAFGDEKISLFKAYLRIILKVFLGFFSFFTMIFSKEKRAIHDFAAGSVVIDKREES